MNYKYILKEIKRANEKTIEAYEKLNLYRRKKNKKDYNYCEYCITEANEILTNLEIYFDIRLKDEKNEQL